MTPAIELTSVPAWALTPMTEPRDPSARTLSAFAIGATAEVEAKGWLQDATAPSTLHAAIDLDDAKRVFDDAAAAARVGWRVLLAGSLVDVLRLRAHVLGHGLTDDEIAIGTTDTSRLAVTCVHCSVVVEVAASIGDVVPCDACERNLLVYHHVSRRKAAFLGFQVDAETWEG